MSLDSYFEKETLPIGDDDLAIPSRVAKLDTHLKFLKDNLQQMEQQIKDEEFDRLQLLKRAKELHISDDGKYKIVEIPVYPKKHVDVEALKRLAPDKFDFINQNLISKAQDKLKEQMNKIQVSIAQADVKAVISNKGLLALIIPEPKEPIGYETSVVKRE